MSEELEDKAETPGETPDPHVTGLTGSRPLGLGIAVLPPLPPDAHLNNQFLPSSIANKKKTPSLRTQLPPTTLPTQIDPEVSTRGGGLTGVVFRIESLHVNRFFFTYRIPTYSTLRE